MTQLEAPRRSVRSFVLRQGRITPGQQRAFAQGWPRYGLKAQGQPLMDWPTLLGREAPRILEIGFGMGDSLISLAAQSPEVDFIGIEVHTPGVGACLAQALQLELSNLKLFAEDAVQVLRVIPEASLDKVLLFFPDPWPKKRHHKRRIVQNAFVSLIAQKLKPGGIFHLATDWQNYAEHMLAVLDACPALSNPFSGFAPSPMGRPSTKFEKRGLKLGHSIWDLIYTRS